jgi:hypothetical protein
LPAANKLKKEGWNNNLPVDQRVLPPAQGKRMKPENSD